MARYEFTEGSSSKFWEITLEGTTLTKRWGRIGTDGQEKVEEFDSKAEAKKAYEAQVREKERKGYTLAEGSESGDGGEATAESAVNPDLEAAILAKPDDVKGYLAYAEWLKGEGDPRAELILLQHSALDVPAATATAVGKKAAKFIEAHAQELLGESLAEAVSDETLKLEWHLGFIREARLGQVDYDSTADIPELLGELLAHPSARFLSRLTLGMASFDGENDYDDTLAVLAKAKPAPPLRSLFIGDFEFPDETEISWTQVGDLKALYKVYPRLQELRVRGGEIGLGKIDLPELRSFTVETGGLHQGTVKEIVKAKWPKLESLEIWFGQEGYGASGGVKDLKPLLDAEGVPALRKLGLRNSEFTDELCAALPKAKILAQLEALDLSMGTMSDAGADTLAQNARAFSHLKSLDVTQNFLTKAGQKSVANVAKSVASGNQRTPYDEESRYAAVGE
ncbi:WGR domain-containing protein [Corallococcus carmarthensis]|uniref:WGR domain-containing protein n=1 Tax=Corallococcus carmarthensis TaxID=2316728 RepID=A0A3A8JRG2_9BACT|nr:WGR domain-containing protein [Corallococcus carmarthensis]RKG97755.1 WGR domain-containing protein [Corallococcus carmarthensis]